MQLHVELPDALADRDAQELSALAREALVGGSTRWESFPPARARKRWASRDASSSTSLGRYNVSIFDDTMDVRKEAGLG